MSGWSQVAILPWKMPAATCALRRSVLPAWNAVLMLAHTVTGPNDSGTCRMGLRACVHAARAQG